MFQPPCDWPAGPGSCEREPPCPAVYSRPLPTSDHLIDQPTRCVGKHLPGAKWQAIDPVKRDQMLGIEIGKTAIQGRIPGVDNVTERAIVTDFAGAFGVGTQVDRLRQGITEVRLQSVTEGMAERDLAGIVVAHTDRIPGVQRGKLRLPESCSLGASVIAEEVEVGQSGGLSITIACRGPLVGINGLRSTLSEVVVVGKLGKEVLEVGNSRHRCLRVVAVSIRQRGKLGSVGKVIAASLGISKVDRLCQVNCLKQV